MILLFFLIFKGCFNKFLMMSAKFATLGHPEIKDILKYLKFLKIMKL